MNGIHANTIIIDEATDNEKSARLNWRHVRRWAILAGIVAAITIAAYFFVLNFFEIAWWASTPLVRFMP